MKSVNLDKTLQVAVDTDGCKAQFFIQVWNPNTTPGTWVSTSEITELLDTEAQSINYVMSSKVDFNAETSEFKANFTDLDFYNLLSTFFNPDGAD
jgi:hypothetical protein